MIIGNKKENIVYDDVHPKAIDIACSMKRKETKKKLFF